jgi:hypothetical protein
MAQSLDHVEIGRKYPLRLFDESVSEVLSIQYNFKSTAMDPLQNCVLDVLRNDEVQLYQEQSNVLGKFRGYLKSKSKSIASDEKDFVLSFDGDSFKITKIDKSVLNLTFHLNSSGKSSTGINSNSTGKSGTVVIDKLTDAQTLKLVKKRKRNTSSNTTTAAAIAPAATALSSATVAPSSSSTNDGLNLSGNGASDT